MTDAGRTALESFRKRRKREGIVRVEVQVRKQDAALVRRIARALADPARAAEARGVLAARFGAQSPVGLKALLAAAPLDGIELARDRDFGRPVDP